MIPVRLGALPDRLAGLLTPGLDRLPGYALETAPGPQLTARVAKGDLEAAFVPVTSVFPGDPRLLVVPGISLTTTGPAPLARLEYQGDLRSLQFLVHPEATHPAAILASLLFAAAGARLPLLPEPGAWPSQARPPFGRVITGDETLTPPPRGTSVVDLPQAWTELTGLPLVWWVWVTGPKGLTRKVYGALHQARTRGRQAACLSPVSFGLTDRDLGFLTLRLGRAQLAGLDRFWKEGQRWGFLPPHRPLPLARFSPRDACSPLE